MSHSAHPEATRAPVDLLSEAQLVSVVQHLADGVIVIDAEAHILYRNDALAGLSTATQPLAERCTMWDAFPDLDADVLSEAFERVCESRMRMTIRQRMPSNERWLEFLIEPTDEGLAVIIRDVTADETSRTLLLQSLTQLTVRGALLDAARDAMIVCDLSGRVEYWNPAAEILYGFTAEEALGQPVDELVVSEAEVVPLIAAALDETGHWSGELLQSTRHGTRRRIESRRQVIRNDRGVAVSVFSVNSDVTETRLAEENRVRAQRLESLGTLAGGIAHNLNNILTPILMSVQVLDQGERDPSRRDTLRMMETGIVRGADMIKQVLDFAKGTDGEQARLSTVDLLDEFVAFCHELLPSTIHIVQHVDRSIAPVVGNSSQLMQVLVNLATNSRDAMPNGGTLAIGAGTAEHPTTAVADSANAGQWVSITVTDDGAGMSPQTVSRIFEPFFTTKEVGQGTGLGLPTVQSIMHSHRGHIEVASEVGAGTTVTLWLPADEGDVHTADGDFVSKRFELPPGKGERILVIDDDPLILTTVRSMLDAAGYSTIGASNGREGLDVLAAASPPFDLILTDVVMPILDGAEVIQHVLAHHPDLPIIAATGFTSNPEIMRSVDAGLVAMLDKPFTATALLDAVRASLDAGATRSAR